MVAMVTVKMADVVLKMFSVVHGACVVHETLLLFQ